MRGFGRGRDLSQRHDQLPQGKVRMFLQIEYGIFCNLRCICSAYGNVVEENLWSAIQAQAQEDSVAVPFGVRQVMQTWTSKKGYPVVTVNRNYVNGRAVVSQV